MASVSAAVLRAAVQATTLTPALHTAFHYRAMQFSSSDARFSDGGIQRAGVTVGLV
jgi:hypothetical protein